jgi:hypothetical protein
MHARTLKKKKGITVVRNVALGAAFVFGGPFAYHAIATFVASDPFIGLFRKTGKAMDDSIGIHMESVELRDYHGAKLASSAIAGRVDIRKDRQAATLYNVRNGIYQGDKGPYRYSAKTAVWNFQTKLITINGGVSVKNKDLDLDANAVTFDDRTKHLHVEGDVTGTIFKGKIVAAAFNYNMDSGAADAGPVEWVGQVALSPQDEEKATPRKWDIKGSHFKSLGNNSDTMIYDNATATDGDLIVVAPIVQQNKKTDVLTASGGIEYYSGKTDIKADSCVVYRKDKRVVLSGHVLMYVKPKTQEDDPPKVEKLPEFKPVTPDQVVATTDNKPLTKDEAKEKEDEIRSSKNFRDFPLVVASERIEYFYAKGSRHAIITGAPQARQQLKGDEWRHVWSRSSFYDGEKETLKLISGEKSKEAKMKNSLGDTMENEYLIVSTKEDDDSIEGGDGSATLYSSQDEIPKDKKTTPPPTTAATKGSGSGG